MSWRLKENAETFFYNAKTFYFKRAGVFFYWFKFRKSAFFGYERVEICKT